MKSEKVTKQDPLDPSYRIELSLPLASEEIQVPVRGL